MRIGLLICVFYYTIGFSQDTLRYHTTYQTAVDSAVVKKRPLCVMLHDTSCSHCVTMKKRMLQEKEVIQFTNSNFEFLFLEGNSEMGNMLGMKNNVHSMPTFLFLDSTQKMYYNFTGELSAKDYINESKLALNPNFRLDVLEREFNKDSSNSQKCYSYLHAIKRGIDKYKMESIARKYLATQSPQSLITPINWKILMLSTSDIQSAEYAFIVDHAEEFSKITKESSVQHKIMGTAAKQIKSDIDRNDSIGYQKNRILLSKINRYHIDSLLFGYDLHFLELGNKWHAYRAEVNKYAIKYAWNDLKTLNKIAVNLYQQSKDSKDWQLALSLALRANEMNNTSRSNYLIGRLYYKLGDKKNALTHALMAKNMSDSSKVDPTELEKFIALLNK